MDGSFDVDVQKLMYGFVSLNLPDSVAYQMIRIVEVISMEGVKEVTENR